MLFKSLFHSLPKFGTVMFVGYIAWIAWGKLGPQRPEIGPLRMEAADRAVSIIVEDLRHNRGDVRSVVMLHFEGDSTGYLSDRLRSTLEQRGTLDLLDHTTVEKVRLLANLPESARISRDTAINIAQSRKANAVLFGRINNFESTPNEVNLDLDYYLTSATSGQTIYSGQYSNNNKARELLSNETITAVRSVPWVKRCLGWMLVVLLLPIFTIGFIRMMVARRSNTVNAFVLTIYTMFDTIMAYLLVGASLSTLLPVICFLLAVLAAFSYNVWVMAFALKLEE